MTIEERADQVNLAGDTLRAIKSEIARAIEDATTEAIERTNRIWMKTMSDAIEDEREACALAAETEGARYEGGVDIGLPETARVIAENIAAAIRARFVSPS